MSEQQISYRKTFGLPILFASLAAMFLCVIYQDNAWVSKHYETVCWVSLPLGFFGAELIAEGKVLRFAFTGLIVIIIVAASISLLST